jgi:hypothetical protein
MDFAKRLVEVEEVLKYLSEEDRGKIPNSVFEYIEKNKDKYYKWEIDKSKSLAEQELSEDTFAILAYISMEYLFNDEQKKLMKQFYELNDKTKYNQ